ncbi:MAG: hypothetical protein V1798_11035 [Pseudomonadota bacterium]
MKLCVCAFGTACGFLSGLAILVVGLINRFTDGYGCDYLKILENLYPGYHAGSGLKNLGIGLIYTIVDGFICGALLALVYNWVAGCCCHCKCEEPKTEAPKCS